MPGLPLILLVALTAVSALQWPAHTAHVHVQRFSSLVRSGRSRALWATDDQQPQPPPPERTSGTGEWADWENDAHVDDPWDPDEALDPSFGDSMFSMMKASMGVARGGVADLLERVEEQNGGWGNRTTTQTQASTMVDVDVEEVGVGVRGKEQTVMWTREADSQDWSGWSEEAPYFDESDVQDDEGNWGRANDESVPKLATDGKFQPYSSYGGEKGVSSQSSDLWASRAELAFPMSLLS
ncbi:hypothetical protein B484DRAFT_423311 [Ochromonadaceae sp. CCMP2298]|nr:hypothetical protein B484DRAFT_423311 [Ochromonadaceae sp. CCMP2298]